MEETILLSKLIKNNPSQLLNNDAKVIKVRKIEASYQEDEERINQTMSLEERAEILRNAELEAQKNS